ncbi:MAG: hypothetical protein H6525_07950 [Actinobacteria bacterium]|nr:hypothetical protein [Actinomycetota bacterium]MCB9412764.1 hypothetical protein [Actinomycetota bacterium]
MASGGSSESWAVTLRGRPLAEISVRLIDAETSRTRATGLTDLEGRLWVRHPDRGVAVSLCAANRTVSIHRRAGGPVVCTPPMSLPPDGTLELADTPHCAELAIAAECSTVMRRTFDTLAPGLGGAARPPTRVVVPDKSPARLAFVAPVSWPDGRPELRLQRTDAPSGEWPRAGVIAHELAHAVHFRTMPLRTRLNIAARYSAWLASKVATGEAPTHAPAIATTPLVAWLEAFGMLGERFDAYARALGSRVSAAELGPGFVDEELSGGPRLSRQTPGYWPIDTIRPIGHGRIDLGVEGHVYASVFVHRGAEVGLQRAVADYLGSGAAGVTSYEQFRTYLAAVA